MGLKDVPVAVATERVIDRCVSFVKARFWLEMPADILRTRRGGVRKDGDMGGNQLLFLEPRDGVMDLKFVLSGSDAPYHTNQGYAQLVGARRFGRSLLNRTLRSDEPERIRKFWRDLQTTSAPSPEPCHMGLVFKGPPPSHVGLVPSRKAM